MIKNYACIVFLSILAKIKTKKNENISMHQQCSGHDI